MASRRNGTLYIGTTSDLVKRVWQHRNGMVRVSPNNRVHTASLYEACDDFDGARLRELQMKMETRLKDQHD